MMMLTFLVVVGVVIFLISEPSDKNALSIVFTSLGIAVLLVGAYNMVLMQGLLPFSPAFTGRCLFGGTLWPNIMIIALGMLLTLMGTAHWQKDTKKKGPDPGTNQE